MRDYTDELVEIADKEIEEDVKGVFKSLYKEKALDILSKEEHIQGLRKDLSKFCKEVWEDPYTFLSKYKNARY